MRPFEAYYPIFKDVIELICEKDYGPEELILE
jgi:hypothetical protein